MNSNSVLLAQISYLAGISIISSRSFQCAGGVNGATKASDLGREEFAAIHILRAVGKRCADVILDICAAQLVFSMRFKVINIAKTDSAEFCHFDLDFI
jgi:hypothetical protein